MKVREEESESGKVREEERERLIKAGGEERDINESKSKRDRKSEKERENKGKLERKRERFMKVREINENDFFKGNLGNSNRQPQPGRENLECYPYTNVEPS